MRRRLTFANVTSCLALFIALGGTGYAAVTLPANSVGTRQIRTNGVAKSEIKSGAVGLSEIATNGVGKGELATNSVGQSEIRTDAVGAGEIKKDAVGTSELQDASIDVTDLSTTTRNRVLLGRAAVARTGTSAGGNAASVTHPGTGLYTVTFDHDVSACQLAATLTTVRTSATTLDAPDIGEIVAQPGTAATQVDVHTFFGAEDPATHAEPAADEPFNLLVAC